MMDFNIGQKVVCINIRYNSFCAYPLEKHKVYSIYGFYTCECGSKQIFLNEIPHKIIMGCRCHRASERRQSYYIWRFRPLIYYNLYHELFENSKEQGEYADISIFIPEQIESTVE